MVGTTPATVYQRIGNAKAPAVVIAHGFAGTLAVSEVVMSIDEYEQSIAWMVDQAAGRLLIIHHAVFNNLEENLDAVRRAEVQEAGAALRLPADDHVRFAHDQRGELLGRVYRVHTDERCDIDTAVCCPERHQQVHLVGLRHEALGLGRRRTRQRPPTLASS